jgi:hypothetical protein
MYLYDNTLLNSSWNEKCFRQICRENQNTFYVQHFFFPEIVLLWDNVEKCYTNGQATVDSMVGTCALHGG